jgi:hypothetical protein
MRRWLRGHRRSVDRGGGGPGIEPRKFVSPGCRRRSCSGRQHGGVRYRQRPAGPAWSEALARRRNLLRGNREISWLAGGTLLPARIWKAGGPKPMMHGHEKSDPAIVATMPANEDGQPSEEPAEPRAGAEGNAGQHDMHRTPRRARMSHGLASVRQAAAHNTAERSPPCSTMSMPICCGQPTAGSAGMQRRGWTG